MGEVEWKRGGEGWNFWSLLGDQFQRSILNTRGEFRVHKS